VFSVCMRANTSSVNTIMDENQRTRGVGAYIIALQKSTVLLFSLILLTYNHETTVAHKGVPVEAVSALQKNLYTRRTAKCIF